MNPDHQWQSAATTVVREVNVEPLSGVALVAVGLIAVDNDAARRICRRQRHQDRAARIESVRCRGLLVRSCAVLQAGLWHDCRLLESAASAPALGPPRRPPRWLRIDR